MDSAVFLISCLPVERFFFVLAVQKGNESQAQDRGGGVPNMACSNGLIQRSSRMVMAKPPTPVLRLLPRRTGLAKKLV